MHPSVVFSDQWHFYISGYIQISHDGLANELRLGPIQFFRDGIDLIHHGFRQVK